MRTLKAQQISSIERKPPRPPCLGVPQGVDNPNNEHTTTLLRVITQVRSGIAKNAALSKWADKREVILDLTPPSAQPEGTHSSSPPPLDELPAEAHSSSPPPLDKLPAEAQESLPIQHESTTPAHASSSLPLSSPTNEETALSSSNTTASTSSTTPASSSNPILPDALISAPKRQAQRPQQIPRSAL